jgi:hypothetical protein
MDEQRKGKAYRLLDKLPPEVRAKIEAALARKGAASVETGKITIRRTLGSDDAPKIDVNGQSYANIDEVPAEYREQVAALVNAQSTSKPAIKINGRGYASLDEVPPEFRGLLQRALGNIPNSGAESSAPRRAPPSPIGASAAAQFSESSERSRGSILWILLGLAAIAAAVYLTLRH